MREPLHATTDLNGLPVYDVDQIPIGKSFGVLADAETGLVRFFDIELDNHSRHVIVPVGHVRVEMHMGRQRVRLRAATADDLEKIPAYEPHVVWHDDAFQNELLNAFGRLFDGERYYAHPAYDHSGLYAGTHPLLSEPLSTPAQGGLRRLSKATEFRVAEGESDIRGWDLMGEHGVRIGKVNDLVIDVEAQQVRYVLVRRETDDQTIAIPIGYVDLDADTVRAPLTADELFELPIFEGEEIQREDEVRLRAALDAVMQGAKRYRRPDFKRAA